MRGKVVRWGRQRFGFISSPDLPVEAYFNHQCIAVPDYSPLLGDEVEFERFNRGLDRIEARFVRPIRTAQSSPDTHTARPQGRDHAAQANAALPAPKPQIQQPRKTVLIDKPVEPAKPPLKTEPTATAIPARRKELSDVLDKLRKKHRRDAEGLETEKSSKAAEVGALAGQVEDARRALARAEGQHGRAQNALHEVERRIASLPTAQLAEREAEVVRHLTSQRDTVQRVMANRFGLVDRIAKARANAASRLGEDEISTYERAREGARTAADRVARFAFSALEREKRTQVSEYAKLQDQLESLSDFALPIFLFQNPDSSQPHVLVAPISVESLGDSKLWRLSSAILSSACHANDGGDSIQVGSVGGCVAASLHGDDTESFLELALEEGFRSRKSLADLKLKAEVEVVELALPIADARSILETPRDLRPRSTFGGTLKEVAERLEIPLAAVVYHVAHRNLPAPDDVLDADAERTLHQLLGIAPATPPDQGSAAPSGASNVVELKSLEDVIRRIEREFPDRIVFKPNSQSEIRDNPFEDVEAAYRALRFMATRYYDSRLGVESIPDFDQPLREASGFWYRPTQSDVTMSQYANHYETEWRGRRVQLGEHIGKGDSRDPRHALRIGFFWDSEARRVVIGYVGQHQRTRAT